MNMLAQIKAMNNAIKLISAGHSEASFDDVIAHDFSKPFNDEEQRQKKQKLEGLKKQKAKLSALYAQEKDPVQKNIYLMAFLEIGKEIDALQIKIEQSEEIVDQTTEEDETKFIIENALKRATGRRWKTGDGRSVDIAQMDCEHLQNTINWLSRSQLSNEAQQQWEALFKKEQDFRDRNNYSINRDGTVKLFDRIQPFVPNKLTTIPKWKNGKDLSDRDRKRNAIMAGAKTANLEKVRKDDGFFIPHDDIPF